VIVLSELTNIMINFLFTNIFPKKNAGTHIINTDKIEYLLPCAD
jgi:hypothetical protein